MKRILCFVLSAALMLTMLCGAAAADSANDELIYSLEKPGSIDAATHVKFGDFFVEGQTNAMSHVAAAGPYVFLKDLGLGDFTVPFTVSEAGTYQFGITLLVLSVGKERATRVQIDNGSVYDIRYINTDEQNGQKQYVTGITQTLTAGNHTFTLSLPEDFNDDTVKTLYFFDFFYERYYTASEVGNFIQEIGEVTLEKEPLIVKARTAYESLSDEEKNLVVSYDILVEAENTLADLKAAKVELIYSLDSPSNMTEAAHVKFGDFFVEGKTNAMSHAVDVGPYVFLKDLGLGDFTAPFTITEAGTYQFGITLLVLSVGKERATLFQIDDGPVYDIRYTNTDEQNGQKQYVTGITQTLTAGDHTVTLSLPADFNDDTIKTLYFFDFFYARSYTANEVGDYVRNIGQVTLEKEPLILQARAAYESLSAEEKALFVYYDILVEAEHTLADLKAAKALDDKLAKIMEELPSMDLKAVEQAVKDANTVYETLTDSQKGHVTLLDACEEAIKARISLLNQQAADAVKELIEKIPRPITVDSGKAIAAARSAYDALIDAQKALVNNYADLQKAEEDYKNLPVYAMGDVNKDGAVNANDALMVLKAAVNKITLTAEETKLADLNEDGDINAMDALAILKIAVGKEV